MHDMATMAQPSAATPSTAASAVQVRTGPTAGSLTVDQVCDLPMTELLNRANATMALPVDLSSRNFDGIDTSTFFGYLVDRPSGITLHMRSDASEIAQDVYVRYLLALHLGLPVDAFPVELQHTIFVGPNLDEVQA